MPAPRAGRVGLRHDNKCFLYCRRSATTAIRDRCATAVADFPAFLGPMVLSNISQSLSGTLNNVFVGQMLGTRALAAMSGVFPIVFFLSRW